MSNTYTATAASFALLGGLLLALAAVGCDDGSSAQEARSNPASASQDDRPGAANDRSDKSGSSSKEHYRTRVRPGTVDPGSQAEVSFEIRPKDGLKNNLEFPNWALEIDAPEGVELADASFDHDDFEIDEENAVATTKMEVGEAGETELTGTATFSVCNDDVCHTLRDEAVSFRVEAAGKGGSGASSHGE